MTLEFLLPNCPTANHHCRQHQTLTKLLVHLFHDGDLLVHLLHDDGLLVHLLRDGGLLVHLLGDEGLHGDDKLPPQGMNLKLNVHY